MMRKLILVCIGSGFLASAALAADPYEVYLKKQSQRGTEIELIRVASEKPLVDTEENDAEVAEILEEAEAIDEKSSDSENESDS